MHSGTFLALSLSAIRLSFAQDVVGEPDGFAKGVTGGKGGKTVTPTTNEELVAALGMKGPTIIVISKTFDFIGSEGSVTEAGCAPWGTAPDCQVAINKQVDKGGWCTFYEKQAPTVPKITYDKAGYNPINMTSDTTVVGVGDQGIIKGKGLWIGGGASNVILQNIAILEINPKYVWGGDAITLYGTKGVWIDHVTVSQIGRMMLVAHKEQNTGITISNCDFDGNTPWSSHCKDAPNHAYWILFLTGPNDQITLMNSYIHKTCGRAPKLGMGTTLHAVNNYWEDNPGHAFENTENDFVLVEGNTFKDMKHVCNADDNGDNKSYNASTFAPTTVDKTCNAILGRDCQPNVFINSGSTFTKSDPTVLDKFKGLTIAAAQADANFVLTSAGFAGAKGGGNTTSLPTGPPSTPAPDSSNNTSSGDKPPDKPDSGKKPTKKKKKGKPPPQHDGFVLVA